MAVNDAQLRNLSAREIISALGRDGFGFDRASGSYQIYYHPGGRRVTLSFHAPSDTFTRKTLKSMIEKEACWTEEDLKRLKLMR